MDSRRPDALNDLATYSPPWPGTVETVGAKTGSAAARKVRSAHGFAALSVGQSYPCFVSRRSCDSHAPAILNGNMVEIGAPGEHGQPDPCEH